MQILIDGSHVAIDSAAIHAHEMKQPKRKSELTGNANWGRNLTPLVTRSSGAAISFILLSTPLANCPYVIVLLASALAMAQKYRKVAA